MKLPLATAWLVVASGLIVVHSAEVRVENSTGSPADESLSSPIASENALSWSDPVEPPSGVGNLVPEGMVPFWGQRTSEEHRDSGLGSPLDGTSWLAHSYSAGSFAGPIEGAAFLNGKLEPGYGSMFGLRFGWDYDHRWGLEKRFGFAQLNVLDLQQHVHQIVNLELGDADLMFYPWGDSVWRPYMMAGVGLSHFNFQDDTGRRINRVLFGMPFGVGVKYFCTEAVSFRLDLVDNLMLGGGGVDTMNNLSLTLGAEFRYDGFGLGHHAARR